MKYSAERLGTEIKKQQRLKMLDADPSHNEEALRLVQRHYKPITLRDFRLAMVARKRTIDDLIDPFRGKIDDPREFFDRVMSAKGIFDGVVIPYRSVIEFYLKEKAHLEDNKQESQRRAERRRRGPLSEEHKQAVKKT